MLTASQIENTNIVELNVDGDVETEDIEAARSAISSKLDENNKVRVLLIYENLGEHGAKGDLGRRGAREEHPGQRRTNGGSK